MTNEDAIAALQGQLNIETASLTATQQRIDAINAAITVLTNGYQADQTANQAAIDAAVATAVAAAKADQKTADEAALASA